jgi:hypothetical protein
MRGRSGRIGAAVALEAAAALGLGGGSLDPDASVRMTIGFAR